MYLALDHPKQARVEEHRGRFWRSCSPDLLYGKTLRASNARHSVCSNLFIHLLNHDRRNLVERWIL